MNFKIVNCTPYDVIYFTKDGDREVYPYTGTVPKVKREYENLEENPIIHRVRHSDMVGLPDEREDVVLIVSRTIAMACPEREDLIIPTNFVRDTHGKILGCRAFEVL